MRDKDVAQLPSMALLLPTDRTGLPLGDVAHMDVSGNHKWIYRVPCRAKLKLRGSARK